MKCTLGVQSLRVNVEALISARLVLIGFVRPWLDLCMRLRALLVLLDHGSILSMDVDAI